MTYYRSHLVAASQTKNISLPFNGLYHSYLGELLDIELEQLTQDMADDEATALYDYVHTLDLKKYHKALVVGYADCLIDSLNDYNDTRIKISNITYEPMNMQNRGDALWCDIDVTTLPIIPLADLQPYATDSLTSYSGFISFYDPNLQHLSGARLENWNDVYITFIVEYLVNDLNNNEYGSVEHSYIESLQCEGGAIELLMNNISDEQASELNNLLYEDK